jgi:hypothetical protein
VHSKKIKTKKYLMKKLLLSAAILVLLTSSLRSQDTLVYNHKNDEIKTLFGNHRARGFYGSFTMGYSLIDGRDAVMMGGRLSWITNHSIAIGLGGTGFINEFHYSSVQNNQVFLTGGYGGIYIEPILMPKFPIHLSFPVLLGAGGISYVSEDANYHMNFIEDGAAFLIAEPSAELEFNITRFFRISLGTSYRFPTPFDIGSSGGSKTASAESLRGWTYNISFKFGKF